MSEVFYKKLLGLLLGLIALFILILAAFELAFLFVFLKNIFLGYAYLGVLIATFTYGALFFKKYIDFRAKLYLFLPKTENIQIMKQENEINIETEDLQLQACIAYFNGDSLAEIKRKFGLSHSTTAQRTVQKGIGFLLHFYNENKGKESKI